MTGANFCASPQPVVRHHAGGVPRPQFLGLYHCRGDFPAAGVAARVQSAGAVFLSVLLAVPAIPDDITGLGVINYFFKGSTTCAVSRAGGPAAGLAGAAAARPDSVRFGALLPDKILAAYLVLQFALMLTVSTFTNTLRIGAFYAFIDIFLPYYVASRALKNLGDFRDALMAFAVASLVLSALAMVEFAMHWLLYAPLQTSLNVFWGYGNYLARGESLRAVGTTGQSPIVLGYVMVVALGFFLFLRKSVASPAGVEARLSRVDPRPDCAGVARPVAGRRRDDRNFRGDGSGGRKNAVQPCAGRAARDSAAMGNPRRQRNHRSPAVRRHHRHQQRDLPPAAAAGFGAGHPATSVLRRFRLLLFAPPCRN